MREEIERSKEPNGTVINIVPWLSRTTLDIIGIGTCITYIYGRCRVLIRCPVLRFSTAAANYDCEAIDNGQNNELTKSYNNIL